MAFVNSESLAASPDLEVHHVLHKRDMFAETAGIMVALAHMYIADIQTLTVMPSPTSLPTNVPQNPELVLPLDKIVYCADKLSIHLLDAPECIHPIGLMRQNAGMTQVQVASPPNVAHIYA